MSPAIQLNIHHMLLACWRRRYLMTIPMALMPVLVLLLGLFTPQKYMSHTTILVQETSRLNPFMADFAVSTQLEERISGLRALLHSRHILMKVAKDTGLITDENSEQALHAVHQLSEALQLQLLGKDMIKIIYTDAKPDQMSLILTSVSKHFLDALLAPEQSSMQGSESFLDSQIKSQQSELTKAEQALAEFKRQHASSLPDQFNFDVQQLRSSENLLLMKLNELAGATAALESFNAQLLKTNPMLAAVEQEMIAEQSNLSQLQSRYTNQHSLVVTSLQNLQRLTEERELLLKDSQQLRGTDIEMLWQLASGMQQSADPQGSRTLLVSQLEALQIAKSKESQLQQETTQLQKVIKELKTKLDAYSAIELQLSSLERDISTKRLMYNDLLKRHGQAEVTLALGLFEQHDRVKVIDPPFTPFNSVNLPLSAYLLLGIVSGISLGACLVLLVETLDSSITRREVIVQICRVPVLTRLPDLSLFNEMSGEVAALSNSERRP